MYLDNPDSDSISADDVTRSDKRVTKCRVGHPQLLTPTEMSAKELSFDTSFKTVHNVNVMLIQPRKARW